MKRLTGKWLIGLAALLLTFIAASEVIMAGVAEPAYETIVADGRFTVRRYEPMIVASVAVTGDRRAAINGGFQLLADYIFGNNDGGAKIAMTAPVLQEPRAGEGEGEGERIAMTSPVVQAPAGANRWEVSFVMPAEYTMASLPKPRNETVQIAEVPPRTVAAVAFSGSPNAGALDRRAAELAEWIAARGMRPLGAPRFAFYDPPWTLPFLRRNEIFVDVER